MRVLILGDRGFIGSQIRNGLQAAGHQASGLRGMDMARALRPEDWHPLIAEVDVVVNAVGVLRDSRARPMTAIHSLAPTALFEAAAQRQLPRLIQISALGLDNNPTLYARTKLAAEQALDRQLNCGRLSAAILRPSIVIGPGGASTRLFETLARLPLLPWPRVALASQVQPVAVSDLARAVQRLLDVDTELCGPLSCVGPEAFSLPEWVARLRQLRGRTAARVWPLPDPLTRLSVRLGDLLPITPWGSETLSLLSQANTGPVEPFARLLGRAPQSALPDLELT